MNIRRMDDADLVAIVELSLQAWKPVFHSFEQVLGSKIYSLIYPDWKKRNKQRLRHTVKIATK